MTRHYATVARAAELPVLLASMRQHCGDFVLHALDWDWPPRRPLESPPMPEVVYTARAAFLARHPELEPSRLPGPPRRPVDVVCTVRWAFFADVLATLHGEPLCCIDGDIHWFGSPEPMWAEIPPSAPMAVTPHRIPPRADGKPGVCRETHACYGEFNGGFSVWRHPEPLQDMAERVRRWSYTEVRQHPVDGGPDFGDQGSLERVAARWGAYVIRHAGVNLAPWNVHGCRLMGRSGIVLVDHPPACDAAPLVAYHFSSLRLAPDGTPAQLANPCYEVERAPGAVELIYEPYLAAVRAAAGGRIGGP